MVFFSIIIPVHRPNIIRLERCLQQICNQTFRQWEALVIDTQSELSKEILKVCQVDRRVSYIHLEENGVYKAINLAVDKTQGHWILILGHDDELVDSAVLAKASRAINSNKLLFWRKAYYGSVVIKGNSVWAKDGDIYDGRFNLYKLLTKNISHQAIFYRGEWARTNKSGYSEAYKVTADWDYNIRAWINGGMGYLPIVISIFRTGGLSSTSTYDGFHGSHALSWKYWQSKGPTAIALIWFTYCRIARKLNINLKN